MGADGLIRIAPAVGADFFMDYSNANGEVAEMCGNGIRCLAKYVYDRGLTTATEIDVQTRAGLKHLVIEVRDGVASRVTVDMGRPAWERQAIPMTGDPSATFIGQPMDVDGRTLTATAVSMGNPHCVLFLPDDDELSGTGGLEDRAHRGAPPRLPEPDERRVRPGARRTNPRAGVGAGIRGDPGLWHGGVRGPGGQLDGGPDREAGRVAFPGGVLDVDWGRTTTCP